MADRDEDDLIGHNGGPDVLNSTAQGQLKSFIQRIERINAEIDDLKEDSKEIYLELKGSGFDGKIVRQIIARRKKDRTKLQEEEAIRDLYLSAIGDL